MGIGFLSFVSLLFWVVWKKPTKSQKTKHFFFLFLSFVFRCLEASEEDDDDDDQQHRGSVMWYTWAVFGYFL
jgi:hypothetical protein